MEIEELFRDPLTPEIRELVRTRLVSDKNLISLGGRRGHAIGFTSGAPINGSTNSPSGFP
jgi:hypothetical protein